MPNPNMAQPMGQPMGMPNPQPIYQPPQPGIVQQQPTVVVVTTNNGAHHSPHTAHPENLVCQSCQSQVISRVEHEAGERTHLTALLLCVLGGGACGICLVPYCMKDCQDAVHYCPQCGTRIGQKTFRWWEEVDQGAHWSVYGDGQLMRSLIFVIYVVRT